MMQKKAHINLISISKPCFVMIYKLSFIKTILIQDSLDFVATITIIIHSLRDTLIAGYMY